MIGVGTWEKSRWGSSYEKRWEGDGLRGMGAIAEAEGRQVVDRFEK